LVSAALVRCRVLTCPPSLIVVSLGVMTLSLIFDGACALKNAPELT
jgi:hypothetical protein